MRVTFHLDLSLEALWRLCCFIERARYIERDQLPDEWRPYLTRSSSRQARAIRAALRGIIRRHNVRMLGVVVWSVAKDWREKLHRMNWTKTQARLPWTCHIPEAA